MATTVGEFSVADPTADVETLRDRIRDEGYLFFRGLLDRDRVLDVRRQFLGALASVGWIQDGTDPMDARPDSKVRTFNDPEWWDGYVAVQRLEAYHALAHSPALKAVMAKLVEGDLLVQPMKIARVTFPNSGYPTHPHQDFFFVRGHSDVFTAWVPLGEVTPKLGALQVLPGSHHEGLRSVHFAKGAGNISADIDPDTPGFLSTHYQPGDVVLFHSLVIHHAPDNVSDQLRISADYRYQSADDPIVPQVIFPHEYGNGRVPGWHELSKDWDTVEWIEAPKRITLAPWRIDRNQVPRSRYARVPTA